MKKLLLILILNATLFPLWGQGGKDSLRYSQEQGTLEKQRFIDQYDYVFMTKEPTKWMLKLEYSTNPTFGGMVAGYERKLSPSIALALGAYHRSISYYSGTDAGIYAELKYYYDMKKRISEGKSANNFSGNYLSIAATQSFGKWSERRGVGIYPFYQFPEQRPVLNAFELRWGMQRRFFNHGVVDFGASLGMVSSDNRITYTMNREPYQELLLQTHWTLGSAWGDFKRLKLPPTCEVLRCYDNNTRLLKIAWPDLIIGLNRQSLATSFAFEQQLGKSKFSLNIQNNLQVSRWQLSNYISDIYEQKDVNGMIISTLIGRETMDVSSSSFSSVTYLQPRFYLKRRNNAQNIPIFSALSGWYVGAVLMHVYEARTYKLNGDLANYRKHHALELGISAGFQQKVFKHGYIDLGLTVSKPLYIISSLTGDGYTFRPNLKLGFAF